ncbi:efflux transporter periplasmic adaptor subunit [Pseudoxanthomonas broegbernensis]|uniref:Efflux transporter periplasmic adaptor subunit n=1 Tax=Pseudoxanthomonas broegbernensis TaxID=83619 RepID=A0A7V8GP22_9GAMM|nr:efflux RND transporter periplasmic adaptor subunit [Pseudoxanthomonas broegbernensis]KAF1687336.1 efflux transporter periplasmic adaptor subunit [Pseudoxanthomonas broegbernensis]MBB6065664.1 membrane fusion protein (multidrug efflux system) [Pseudoxanthomonas broegbernensis]
MASRVLAGGWILVGVLGMAACGRDASPPHAAAPIPVTTATVRSQAWSDTVHALGTVHARESVTLTAKVSEIVDQVHFQSGQQVQAGQPLVTLRVAAQQAALVEAQAAADEAEQQLRRLQGLAGQQLVSRSTLDAQRATRDAAAARVRQMRSDIADRHVRAPFAGVLGIRQVSPGALLTPNAVIATLDDISRVYADFQVPEAALSAIAPGARVAASGAAWPGHAFEGEVETVVARIDPVTRTVTVRAAFDNPERRLRPGMLLQVSLFRPQREALVVPEIAVVQVGRESFVYRVGEDGKVERAVVETGVRRDGLAEVVRGLHAGDRVVVDGTGKLRPGVSVTEAAPAEAPPQKDADAGAPARD